MYRKTKNIIDRLYSQTNDLGAYSHNLSAEACDKAFRYINAITLAVMVEDIETLEQAEHASAKLEELVYYAKNR